MSADPIDPHAVMERHGNPDQGYCCSLCRQPWPCETYRLAEALSAEQAKVAREIEMSDNLRRTYQSLLASRDRAQTESAWRHTLIRTVVNYDNANASDLPLGLLDSLREVAAEPIGVSVVDSEQDA